MTTPTGPDPWADPATETRPGAPYAGPPPTGPSPFSVHGAVPGYGWAPGAAPGSPWYPGGFGSPPAWPPGGWLPGGWPPLRPRRPGQVVAAAVLAFVQAALALVGTAYTYMLASLAGLTAGQGGLASSPTGLAGLAAEGTVLALVQLVSVIPLVVGGILVLTRRAQAAWLTLVIALGAQLAIALYWTLRLSGTLGDGFDAAGGPLAGFTFAFAAAPLVALGLVLAGPGRRWFGEPARPDGRPA